MLSENLIGMSVQELPTPCLIVDMRSLEHNISIMQEYVRDHTHCQLRPHIKTHKCPQIAHMQIRSGAIGVTCAKLGEAEVMTNAGIGSILIANQVIGENKIKVLAGLNRYADVMPCVDNAENISNISKWAVFFGVHIPVLIEVDAGLNRCGVRTIQDAMDLANLIKNLPNINLRGIQAYEGRVKSVNAAESLQSLITKSSLALAIEVKKALIINGHPVEIMSCASTGTVLHTARIPEVTEVQPGSYVLMETVYKASEIGLPFEQALFVLATVCSVHKDRIVLTAGKKAITIDQGFPVVMNDMFAHMEFHEEHAILTNSEDITQYHLGETVTLIPSHCCTTVNQHEHLFCVRDGIVEAVWDISARGRYD